jgi:hypothetical protein
MQIHRRAVVGLTMLLVVAGAAPALAGSPSGDSRKTVVIDGREYGRADGLQVDTVRIEVKRGSGRAGALPRGSATRPGVTPLATWGSSYAISTETLQFFYDGKAKAAGNVFAGLRIIQVCIWYTRAGAGVVGAKVCSNANPNTGVWRPGPEVRTSATDSINPFDPHTVFNISTTRINPGII